MKLQDALEIAIICDLETVGEALLNIKFHSGNMFNYGEEITEYKELIDEFNQSGYTLDTKILDIK